MVAVNGDGGEMNYLARCIEQRMVELDLSPTDLAAETGLTLQALANVRKGLRRRYQRRLTGPLTRALGWSPDSITRAMDGRPPIVEVARPPRSRPQRPSQLVELEELRRRVARLEARQNAELSAVEDLTTRGEALDDLLREVASRLTIVESRLGTQRGRRGGGGAGPVGD